MSHSSVNGSVREACVHSPLPPRTPGTKTTPLLHGQQLDYLRRVGGFEQWQCAEVVSPHLGKSSYGGVDPVTLKITSSGDCVLGVSYARAPDETAPPSGDTFVLDVDPGALAPLNTRAKWVPGPVDVNNVSDCSTSSLDLARRSSAFFRDSPDAVARYLLNGRSGVVDFEVIDVLPPPPVTRKMVPHAASAAKPWELLQSALDAGGRADDEAAPPPPDATKGSDEVDRMRQWFIGRVQWHDLGGSDGSSRVAMVYWFEPAMTRGGGAGGAPSVSLQLRLSRLEDELNILITKVSPGCACRHALASTMRVTHAPRMPCTCISARAPRP